MIDRTASFPTCPVPAPMAIELCALAMSGHPGEDIMIIGYQYGTIHGEYRWLMHYNTEDHSSHVVTVRSV